MEKVIFFDYNSVFSSRLRSLIEEKNISKQKLADEIGVSRQAISQYCDGSTIPNADKLLKIAEYFNVSLDYLVGKTDAKTCDKDIRFICDYTGLSEEAVSNLHKYNGNSSMGFKGLDIEPIQDVYLEFINYLLEYDIMDTDIFLKVTNCKRKIKYYSKIMEIIKSHIDTLSQSFINDDLHYTYKEFLDQCTQEIFSLEDIQRNSRIDYIECVDAFEKILSEFVKPEKEELEAKIKQCKKDLNEISHQAFIMGVANADNNEEE